MGGLGERGWGGEDREGGMTQTNTERRTVGWPGLGVGCV